jgi:hypothetical protein
MGIRLSSTLSAVFNFVRVYVHRGTIDLLPLSWKAQSRVAGSLVLMWDAPAVRERATVGRSRLMPSTPQFPRQ